MFQEQLAQAQKINLQKINASSTPGEKKYYSYIQDLQSLVKTTHVPTRDEEFWKYVDLKFLSQNTFVVASASQENRVEYSAAQKTLKIHLRSVADSAKWKASPGLPESIEFFTRHEALKQPGFIEESVSYAWKHENYFSQLGTALEIVGPVVYIKKSWDPEVAIELYLDPQVSSANHQFVNLKLTFILESQAEAMILEKNNLEGQAFINSGIDYVQGVNSQLKILKIETGGRSGWGCHTARYKLDRDAKLFSTTATIGSNWSRHNVSVELIGEGAHADVLATYLAEGQQFVDHHTSIEHQVPHTTSLQKYTGVLADKAKAVFNGQVKIHRYAQKSDAVQINRNLLLSKTAEVNTKPELQIDADDVKAKHGATVGQIQPDELFYLQSRGIPETKARSMLVRGFVEEIGLLQPKLLKTVYFKEVSSYLDKVAEL